MKSAIMTRDEALQKVVSAIKARGMTREEYWTCEPYNGDCPEAVSIIRALEALGLIKFDGDKG
jgi:hypothetical protein